jgi:hypothetical protein
MKREMIKREGAEKINLKRVKQGITIGDADVDKIEKIKETKSKKKLQEKEKIKK